MTDRRADAASVSNERLALRGMTLADFDAYFAMKCDPEDVRLSGFAQAPDRDRLRRWLEAELANPSAMLLLAVCGTAPAGYLFLRRSAAEPDAAEISYGVAAPFRGRRFGQAMNDIAIEHVRRNLADIARTICWVAQDNVASVKNVTAAGYRDSGETRVTRFLAPAPHDETMRKFVFAIVR